MLLPPEIPGGHCLANSNSPQAFVPIIEALEFD